jgi:hypothetical protein
MKKSIQTLRLFGIGFGFLSVAFFIYDFLIFSQLKPKMVNFELITRFEENLITLAGIGFVVFLLFHLLSLLALVRYVKHANELKPWPLFLVITGVVSLLFVFSDVALLRDIHKQYRYGFAQPEWSLIYPIIACQLGVTLTFTYLHLSGYFVRKQYDKVTRDVNVFLVVQYVGLICGLFGLASASLGFVFDTAWHPLIHVVLNGLILFFPYALAVFYWLLIKLREKDRQWFDEKQFQDVGKSAMLTLVISGIAMTVLFIINYQDLAGVIRMLWLPLYLFGIIFLFSLGNIVYSNRV